MRKSPPISAVRSTITVRWNCAAGSMNRCCPVRLILDFSGVTFMDSSGIGLIMGRWRLMQEQGGHLLVQGVPRSLRKVMKVSGLDKLGVLEEKEEVKQ